MKNPHSLTHSWNPTLTKESVLMSVPSTNKKFKRKSREPKRLFSSPEPDLIKSCHGAVSDDELPDAAAAAASEVCRVGRLLPLQRQLMMSQEEAAAATAGILTGLSEDGVAAAQTGALDMRIGINMAAVASKLSQHPPFSSAEISHWPTAISQPLSNRLKLRPTFPLSTSTGAAPDLSPSHQAFSLDPPLTGQASSLPVSRTFRSSQCHEEAELQEQSPKESPKRRVESSADGHGRHPEVKAVQQTRRLLANARERTRVHTISAAFEALRKQVPCYSYGQKLSKLAILRIACNYILSLAQLAELDYSPDHGSVSFSQCVEQCTRTLQAEGRSKKRKVGRIPEEV